MSDISQDEVKRYEVVIERRFIIYAPTSDDAGRKALAWEGFKGKGDGLAGAPVKVLEVHQLPALLDEVRVPIIDRSPSGVPVGAK